MERDTQQRRAIRSAIEQADRPLSPREVLDASKTLSPGLGIATVYRTLKSWLESGWLQQVDLPGFPGELDYARDLALGVNYSPAAGLVLKLEGHRARGYFFDSYVDVAGPAGESTYGIASVSVSF